MQNFLEQAANVVPSPRQLKWFDKELYAFIHFGVNTYTDREWGNGQEPESIFNPTKLDCDQWVAAAKSAGCTGMVITAKHHDGFCLWPSKYTEHSVKNSPFNGDVVREVSEACKRGGIEFGFYLSPWDMNSALYGTPEYNDYFCNQLTELLTEYGDVFYVWFDNACGEGENGKKQEYDFPRYFDLIRKYQPNAVIFNDFGPDIRWCGNESGTARYKEWAVVPGELCYYADKQTEQGPLADKGNLDFLYNTDGEIGALSQIMYSKGLCFCPSEIDMSIRKGWFWHQEEEPHSLKRLCETYLTSVGANSCLHLNIPPNREGLIDERDVKRLKEFGDMIKRELGTPLPVKVERMESPDYQPSFELHLENLEKAPRYVVIKEELTKGQRIESFSVSGAFFGGDQFPLYQGTCVGHKRICPLTDPFAEQNPLLDQRKEKLEKLIVKVKASRGEVFIKDIQVF